MNMIKHIYNHEKKNMLSALHFTLNGRQIWALVKNHEIHIAQWKQSDLKSSAPEISIIVHLQILLPAIKFPGLSILIGMSFYLFEMVTESTPTQKHGEIYFRCEAQVELRAPEDAATLLENDPRVQILLMHPIHVDEERGYDNLENFRTSTGKKWTMDTIDNESVNISASVRDLL